MTTVLKKRIQKNVHSKFIPRSDLQNEIFNNFLVLLMITNPNKGVKNNHDKVITERITLHFPQTFFCSLEFIY